MQSQPKSRVFNWHDALTAILPECHKIYEKEFERNATRGGPTTSLNLLSMFLAFPFHSETWQTIKETPKILEYNSPWNLVLEFYGDDFFNGRRI